MGLKLSVRATFIALKLQMSFCQFVIPLVINNEETTWNK